MVFEHMNSKIETLSNEIVEKEAFIARLQTQIQDLERSVAAHNGKNEKWIKKEKLWTIEKEELTVKISSLEKEKSSAKRAKAKDDATKIAEIERIMKSFDEQQKKIGEEHNQALKQQITATEKDKVAHEEVKVAEIQKLKEDFIRQQKEAEERYQLEINALKLQKSRAEEDEVAYKAAKDAEIEQLEESFDE